MPPIKNYFQTYKLFHSVIFLRRGFLTSFMYLVFTCRPPPQYFAVTLTYIEHNLITQDGFKLLLQNTSTQATTNAVAMSSLVQLTVWSGISFTGVYCSWFLPLCCGRKFVISDSISCWFFFLIFLFYIFHFLVNFVLVFLSAFDHIFFSVCRLLLLIFLKISQLYLIVTFLPFIVSFDILGFFRWQIQHSRIYFFKPSIHHVELFPRIQMIYTEHTYTMKCIRYFHLFKILNLLICRKLTKNLKLNVGKFSNLVFKLRNNKCFGRFQGWFFLFGHCFSSQLHLSLLESWSVHHVFSCTL